MQINMHRQFFVPFSKVDKAKRVVWGVAQSEAVDCQDDLLTFESSLDAFSNWSGNIREQHDDTKAVGRAIEIIADKTARKIVVGARISIGAEDTWQKVLDGTLTGYSIGGLILEGVAKYDPDLQRDIRVVSKYELFELSLVDVPANSTCVITAVQKSANGKTLVATDVLNAHSLGALTLGDLLKNHQKGSKMTKRAKVQPVVEFTKSLDANDKVILVHIDDITKTPNGTYVMKKSARISNVISKEDFQADGYDNDADDSKDDDDKSPANIDFADHAEKCASMHKDMCKMAGIDDNEAHYADVTRDDEQGDEGDENGGGADDNSLDPINASKSRSARRRAARRRAVAKSATPSALEAKVDSLMAAVETLAKSNAVAPRKGIEGEGVPVVKAAAVAAPSEEDAHRTELVALEKQRDDLIAKSGQKPNDEERRERVRIGERMSLLRTKLGG